VQQRYEENDEVDDNRTAEEGRHPCLATANLRSLWGFFVLNTTFATAQMTAAVVANSLSMVSDSASMIVDSLTYAVNIYAERQRVKSGKDSARAEVYASIFSVLALIVVTIVMFFDAADRLCCSEASDESVDGSYVLGFASGNLVIDIAMSLHVCWQQRKARIAEKVRDGTMAQQEINLTSAVVHVLADTLRTITGMVAGAIELGPDSDPRKVDAVASIVICVLIVFGASFVLRAAVNQLRALRYSDRVVLLQSAALA